MTVIWNDNDYLSERMRDLAEIGDVRYVKDGKRL